MPKPSKTIQPRPTRQERLSAIRRMVSDLASPLCKTAHDKLRLQALLTYQIDALSVQQAICQQEKPMTIVAFAKRVGLSRWAIQDRIRDGKIITKNGKIPPSELRKFGL